MKLRRVSVNWVLVILLAVGRGGEGDIVAAAEVLSSPPCQFPAIYNFGDSDSDTGGISAAFYPAGSPSGETYFGRPSGRGSDGRLMIDFISEHLGLPYLSAYLDTMRTSYRHGANFATGGSTVRRPTESWFLNGVSPFSLEIQTAQFDQFKVRSTYYFKQYGNKKDDNDDDDDEMKLRDSRLPRPEDFSKTLYVFDIGQNDLAAGFRNLGYEHLERLNETIPDVVEQLAAAVRHLYGQGGRAFWIHNTGPIGCLPITHRWVVDPVDGYLDEVGCVKDQNRMASEFNRQLEDKVLLLRDELAGAALTYVDVYLAKYELISGAKEQGFGDPMKMCCGVEWEDKHVSCGQTATFNGTKVYAGSCKDPSSFISWDGTHYTEAANRWLADRIVNGSFSDQNTPIWHSCRRS